MDSIREPALERADHRPAGSRHGNDGSLISLQDACSRHHAFLGRDLHRRTSRHPRNHKLLLEYEAVVADSNSRGLLMQQEELALRNFKASKGWARKTAVRYGWRIVGSNTAMEVDGRELGGLDGVVNGGMFVEWEHVEGNNRMPIVVDGAEEMLYVALADEK